MLVLDATFNLRSKRGKRSVRAREFFLGPFQTALAEDEMLIDVVLPPTPRGAGSAWASQDQAASGYSLAGAAAVVARSRKTVSHAAVALTGIGDVARLIAATDQLVGTRGEPDVVARVASAAVDGIEVTGDIHASAEYRRHLATVMVRRAITRAMERAA